MLHDDPKQRGLEMRPVDFTLGHGNEVLSEHHRLNAGKGQESRRKGSALGAFDRAKFERALREHGLAGEKFQGGGIGSGFGLDKHLISRCQSRFKAGAARGHSSMDALQYRRNFAPPLPGGEKTRKSPVMTEETALLAANAAYYQAFSARDIKSMAALWAPDGVSCIHPGWPPLIGRQAVLSSYGDIFRNPRQEAIQRRNETVLVEGSKAACSASRA